MTIRVAVIVPISSGPENLSTMDRLATDLRSQGYPVEVTRVRAEDNGGSARDGQTKGAVADTVQFIVSFAAGKGFDWCIEYLRDRVKEMRVHEATIEEHSNDSDSQPSKA
jgi:hypothetical protein